MEHVKPVELMDPSTNDVLQLSTESAGTQFESAGASRTAFVTLLNGTRWMIYENAETSVLHYDFVRDALFDFQLVPYLSFRACSGASSRSQLLISSEQRPVSWTKTTHAPSQPHCRRIEHPPQRHTN